MTFMLIEGGRGKVGSGLGRHRGPPDAAAVRAEAVRRLRASGCEAARMRALLTGRPLPPVMRYLQLQIDYATEALVRLHPIPADFCSDRYWPPGRTEPGAGNP